MNFVLKARNFVFFKWNCVSKARDFVFKMSNFAVTHLGGRWGDGVRVKSIIFTRESVIYIYFGPNLVCFYHFTSDRESIIFGLFLDRMWVYFDAGLRRRCAE